eukprot:2098768-Rhodomonas_salina.3
MVLAQSLSDCRLTHVRPGRPREGGAVQCHDDGPCSRARTASMRGVVKQFLPRAWWREGPEPRVRTRGASSAAEPASESHLPAL